MHKKQILYDTKIQIHNRNKEIQQLQYKIARLKKLRNDIYNIGQYDKQQNNRRTTLEEYKEKISQYDTDIKNKLLFVKSLKERNGILLDKSGQTSILNQNDFKADGKADGKADLQHTADLQFRSCKFRRDTPKYPVDLLAMRAIAETIIENGDLSEINADVREWIINLYKKDNSRVVNNLGVNSLVPVATSTSLVPVAPSSTLVESFSYDKKDINNVIDSLDKEIDKSIIELDKRRCCF